MKITVAYGNKCGGRYLSCGVEKDVPEGKTELQFIDETENWLREYVDQKIKSYMSLDEVAQKVATPEPMPAGNTNISPLCPQCNAPMQPSKNGKYWNCTKASWARNFDGSFVNSGCNGSRKR